MKLGTWSTFGASAVLLCSVVACDTAPEAAQPAAAAKTSEVSLPTELIVDPALLSSGRITLEEARPAGPGAMRRIPGEVVSSPDGAAEVGVLSWGRISEILVNVGDTVAKGQILAWLVSPDVGGARADVTRGSAARELQRSRLARQEELEKQGATSQSNLDEARAFARSADADYSSATQRLSALGATTGSGSKYGVVSPIDGVITESTAVLGAAARPEELLFRVIAPERVLIVARFPEGKSGIPGAGDKARIIPRGASTHVECEAVVETNTKVVDPHTRTVLVRLRPDSSCAHLRPGAYVEVAPLEEGASEDSSKGSTAAASAVALQISSQAVVYVREKKTVFVADSVPGKFHARAVHVVSVDGEYSTIDEGLRAGERVVVRGTILLKGEMLREVLGGD